MNRNIVLIEDNEADASIIREALSALHFACDVTRFADGADALPVLLQEDGPIPDLILLDLNMPRSHGLDVLKSIRGAPRLTHIPVGILTGSEASGDKLRAAVLGTTLYVHKSSEYGNFIKGVQQAVRELLQLSAPG